MAPKLSQSPPKYTPKTPMPKKKSSLLLGKLVGSFNKKSQVDQKMGSNFLENNKVPEQNGEIIARDKDIMWSTYVANPLMVLKKLGYMPKIVNGKILAGDANSVNFLNKLPSDYNF